MKIAFISDIHSNIEALEVVLDKIDSLGIEKIYCVGDVISYGSNPNECLEIIRKRKIPCVRGNHEDAVIRQSVLGFNPYAAKAISWTISHISRENLEFIKEFPEKIETMQDGLRMLTVHGSPFDPINEYVFPNYPLEKIAEVVNVDIIAMGHTHFPFVKEVEDRLMINAGSVGQPRDNNPDACYLVLDTTKRDVEIFRVKYNVKTAAKKIIKSGLPEILAWRLYVGV